MIRTGRHSGRRARAPASTDRSSSRESRFQLIGSALPEEANSRTKYGSRTPSATASPQGATRASGVRKGRETPVNSGRSRSTTDTRKPAPTRPAALWPGRTLGGHWGFDSPQLHEAPNGHLPGLLPGVKAQQGDCFGRNQLRDQGFVGVADGGVQPPRHRGDAHITTAQRRWRHDLGIPWRKEGGCHAVPER